MAYYRGAQSPRDEHQYTTNPLSPPSQRNPNRWSANMATTNDVRGALTRRFTTNTVPTLSPIGQQRRQAAGDMQAVSQDEHQEYGKHRCYSELESLGTAASLGRDILCHMATVRIAWASAIAAIISHVLMFVDFTHCAMAIVKVIVGEIAERDRRRLCLQVTFCCLSLWSIRETEANQAQTDNVAEQDDSSKHSPRFKTSISGQSALMNGQSRMPSCCISWSWLPRQNRSTCSYGVCTS